MTEAADPQIDALLEALGDDGAEALLAEMTGAMEGAERPQAEILSPQNLKAKMATLAKTRPELLAKIITHWITEERRRGR